MKVAVYEGVKSIRLEERPDPEAGPGEVIVRVKYCGICGTDVHAYWYEPLDAPGQVFGHETVGTIAEIGNGVEGWKTGDRVLVSHGGGGGMAEYVRVTNLQGLYRIPDEVSFEDAVLWDPIAVPLRGIRQSRFQIGDDVVVAGAGAIGLSAVQLLSIGGARRVIILEPLEKKREFALRSGAHAGFNPIAEGPALAGKVRDYLGGDGADIAYECAGSPQSFQACISLVKRAGQVLLIGVTDRETPIIESALIRGETEIKGSLIFTGKEIRLTLDLLASKRFDTKGIVSDIIGLGDIVKGMERLVSPDESLIKVVVAP